MKHTKTFKLSLRPSIAQQDADYLKFKSGTLVNEVDSVDVWVEGEYVDGYPCILDVLGAGCFDDITGDQIADLENQWLEKFRFNANEETYDPGRPVTADAPESPAPSAGPIQDIAPIPGFVVCNTSLTIEIYSPDPIPPFRYDSAASPLRMLLANPEKEGYYFAEGPASESEIIMAIKNHIQSAKQ